MTENVKQFMTELSKDPVKMEAFWKDPASFLATAALSAEEKASLESGDAERIRRLVGRTDPGNPGNPDDSNEPGNPTDNPSFPDFGNPTHNPSFPDYGNPSHPHAEPEPGNPTTDGNPSYPYGGN